MKKKALIVVSAAVLALALAACGATGTSGSSGASTAASGAGAAATETLTVEELHLHLADGAAPAVVTVEPADLAGQLTYKTGDDAIATVDETGLVTPVKEGHTSLLVLAPDGTRGKAMITVWSGPKELTLTADGEAVVGGTVALSAADETGAAVDAATLAWSSSDDAVATVDAAGAVTVVGAGEAVITAETAWEIEGSITLTVQG